MPDEKTLKAVGEKLYDRLGFLRTHQSRLREQYGDTTLGYVREYLELGIKSTDNAIDLLQSIIVEADKAAR